MVSAGGEYTAETGGIAGDPRLNKSGRSGGLADGIVITPSQQSPEDGGFKYNPTHGGRATATSPAGSRTRPIAC